MASKSSRRRKRATRRPFDGGRPEDTGASDALEGDVVSTGDVEPDASLVSVESSATAVATETTRRPGRPLPPPVVNPVPGGTPLNEFTDRFIAPVPGEGPAEASATKRWGIGDAIGGWAVAQLASILAIAGVITYLGFPAVAGMGGAIGQAAGQSEIGSALDILSVYGDLPFEWQVALQIPLWVGLIGAPLYAARRKGTSLAVDFGLRVQRKDIPVGLVIGVLAQLVLVPLVYVPLRALGGSTEDVSEPAQQYVNSASGPLGVVLLLLVVGLGAPFAEELFYRGLTQRAVLHRLGRPAWAVVVAALFFAFAHLQSLQFPALVAVGVLFGVLAQRSGRLGPPIFAHVGFNLTTAVVFLFDLNLPFS